MALALAGALVVVPVMAVAAPTPRAGRDGRTVLSASDRSVQLRVALNRTNLHVGKELRADVDIRNVGNHDVYWQAGGCGRPVELFLGQLGRFDYQPGWDGKVPLAHWLRHGNEVYSAVGFKPLGFPDVLNTGCTLASRMLPIHPGDDVRWVGVATARVGAGSIDRWPLGQFTAWFTGYDRPADFFEKKSRSRLQVTWVFPLADDKARATSADAAIEAFSNNDRLADFLTRTRVVRDFPNADQHWKTRFSWSHGAWELLIQAVSGNELNGLRLRYEPGQKIVVSVEPLTFP